MRNIEISEECTIKNVIISGSENINDVLRKYAISNAHLCITFVGLFAEYDRIWLCNCHRIYCMSIMNVILNAHNYCITLKAEYSEVQNRSSVRSLNYSLKYPSFNSGVIFCNICIRQISKISLFAKFLVPILVPYCLTQ